MDDNNKNQHPLKTISKRKKKIKTLLEELESAQKEQQKKRRAKKTLSEEERELEREFAGLIDWDKPIS